MSARFILLFMLAAAAGARNLPSADGVIDWRRGTPPTVRKATARAPSNPRTDALDYLNAMRTGAGLIAFDANATLDTAAQNHVNYLLCVNAFGHYENQNDCPDKYTGDTPSDRGTAAGYSWQAYGENISAGSPTIIDAVDGLMSAIYHRFGFLTFSMDEIGIGYGSDSNYAYGTLYNFDMGNRNNVSNTQALNPDYVLWPYDGYRKAQTSFDNTESPDPLPECNDYGVAGNPVSVAFNPDDTSAVSLDAFRLYDANGTEITDTKILSSANDNHLDNHKFVLFSMHSLHIDREYRATFDYTRASSQHHLEWTFRTTRYDDPHYDVTDGGSYDIVSGKPYIIQLRPADCNITLNPYSYSYSGSAPTVERLGYDLFRITATGDVTFYFPDSSNPHFTYTLNIAASDNAVAPSPLVPPALVPVVNYLLF